MISDAKTYTSGLKNYLRGILDADFSIEELSDPESYIKLGIDSAIHVKNKKQGLDFYAGFIYHGSGKSDQRLRFFLQLTALKETDFMQRNLSEISPTKKKRVSKNLGETVERFNFDSQKHGIYSVYCKIKNPDHLKPEDLYYDLRKYFLEKGIHLNVEE